MKCIFLVFGLVAVCAQAQVNVDLSKYNGKGEAKVSATGQLISCDWPAGSGHRAKMTLDLANGSPLFKIIGLQVNGTTREIAAGLDPVFLLTIGKRTLSPESGGWDVFFDKVNEKPYQSYPVQFTKLQASVRSEGSRTIVRIGSMQANAFKGALEITLYNGSPLFNIASVLLTQQDSTAILYDAGLVSRSKAWDTISWSSTANVLQTAAVQPADTSRNLQVKYRTVIGQTGGGSLAVFPSPHQYFYPLDEAFNLNFVWYGSDYRKMVPGFGLGIRQDPNGDRRFVPWFNAPPGTEQRLNFFCLLDAGNGGHALEEVKRYTHSDVYPKLDGYKTMTSHFHNEFIMQVVMAGKPIPAKPNFVDVFRNTGVDIVHLGEFHYTAHPKGPDEKRLAELKALFEQCRRLSDTSFLLLPGEEPNEFFGGHWMELFPRPVYWIMSRKERQHFVSEEPGIGRVYRIGSKDDMFRLLKEEKGLAWTAHARTKGSVGYPDKYRHEEFFKSDRFFGAAWKAIPADLSLPSLSRRVLDLLDDMNNWGLKKHIIAESDLFSVEPENEMYAHLNVNYLKLDKLPSFDGGWQPVLDAMERGDFFSGTGEVLLPAFAVNGKSAGQTLTLPRDGKVNVTMEISWTFPLNYAEIISGGGSQVYRQRIDLKDTRAFGKKKFSVPANLRNRKWVRLEVWDAAVNGAFTQTVWLE